MPDARVTKLAQILVDHSTEVKPGDRIAIEATTVAEPLVSELYSLILERGGHPLVLLDLPDQDELLFAHGKEAQLDLVPPFRKLVYEEFEGRIRIASLSNPRGLSDVDPAKMKRRSKAISPILAEQMRRGADRSFKWVSTLFPTEGYAHEAGMTLKEFEDFVYKACHAVDKDPVGYWKKTEAAQTEIVRRFQGHDRVELKGPNADITLSIKGRTFVPCFGQSNMPDGEVFTGPVENSVNGWVRFTYPAIYNSVMVEGVELTFTDGKVTKAQAENNQPYLLEMIDSDPGARYLGEFAIGTNYEIDRFSHNILFDEKLGGTFHMALGSGYPETGSTNHSSIHWDMICGMKEDSEIKVDGELIYRNGHFIS